MDSATTTVLVSVATSSAVAALLTGLFASRNERKKQLLESRRILAGDFAGEAMGALAKLRHYKPTIAPKHRNDELHADPSLRAERADEVAEAIDRLRPLRGRVWVTFPGRSTEVELDDRGPRTTSDWAERVIGALRAAQEECERFWEACEREPRSRPVFEMNFGETYHVAQQEAWDTLDEFADSAARRLERSAVSFRRFALAGRKPRLRGGPASE